MSQNVVIADLFKGNNKQSSSWLATWSVRDFYLSVKAKRYFFTKPTMNPSTGKESCKLGLELENGETVFIGCGKSCGLDPVALKDAVLDLSIGYAKNDKGVAFYSVYKQGTSETSGTF